jgi:uridine phosphorylase
VFVVDNLLREARRQLGRPEGQVPRVCVLDPDGDLVRYLRQHQLARASSVWACYHTELDEFDGAGATIGIVGCAVGAPFAVLVAEEMIASGCELVISLTSAGRIASSIPESCIIVIDRALRGEGTSQAYLPPATTVCAPPELVTMATEALSGLDTPVLSGTTWTTDAPFRETASAIALAADEGALAVEMEAAALYAFAQASQSNVLCLAHVTNSMAVTTGDFEKGASNGAEQALAFVDALASAFIRTHSSGETK